jgi:hypothetical protein
MKQILALSVIIFFICTKILGQDLVYVNTVLFEDSSKIKPYPYGEYDRDEPTFGFVAIDYFPTLYAICNNKKYSYEEYFDTLSVTVPYELWALIYFRVEWDGGISKAFLGAYRGEHPNIDLIKSIARNIHFSPPLNKEGVPYPQLYYRTFLVKGKKWLSKK